MLPDRLQALLVRFYSKNEAADKAEIAQLGTLDWDKEVRLFAVSENGQTTTDVVAPGNGAIFTTMVDKTVFNGLQRKAGQWLTLFNLGTNTGVNSCMWGIVSKGDTITVHQASSDTQTRECKFVPFLGGGVKHLLTGSEAAYVC